MTHETGRQSEARGHLQGALDIEAATNGQNCEPRPRAVPVTLPLADLSLFLVTLLQKVTETGQGERNGEVCG